jgi:hypothetical protein
MSDKVVKFFGWVIIVVAIFFAAVIIFGSLTGCRVTRGKQTVSLDSAVSKVDSIHRKDSLNITSVSKSSKETKEAYTEKETEFVFPEKRDSAGVVNNYFPTKVIYREKTGTKEATENKSDSVAISQLAESIRYLAESNNKRLETLEKNSKSETKGLGAFMIVLILIGSKVFSEVIDYLKAKFLPVNTRK